MLKYVNGDILLSKAEALAHGVSPNDNFSSGLAFSLRENWPALYKDFRHYCQSHHPQPGTLWEWAGAGGIRIINLMTQSAAYGRGVTPGKATLENVNHVLRELRKLIETENLSSVALPRLATGVGGLDWADVMPLIERHLGDFDTKIIVYATYTKGEEADEGL